MKQVEKIGCVGCGNPHNIDACPLNTEIVAYVKHDPYSNAYNIDWRSTYIIIYVLKLVVCSLNYIPFNKVFIGDLLVKI